MSTSRVQSKRFELGVSLVAFRSAAEIRRFEAALRERFGCEALYELSYTTPAALLRQLGFARGRVVSSHAPCPPTELFPNLGSREPRVAGESLETIRRSAAAAARLGAGLLVLHPGYTTDAAVFADSGRRLAALAAAKDPEDEAWLWLREGTICRPGYCDSPHYRRHLAEAMDNLHEAARLCAEHGVRLAVENLNPRLTYLFQLPAELAALAEQIPEIAICVDLGHLWISCLVHGLEFTQSLQQLLDTGRVLSVHVHDNASTLGPPPALGDDHALIGSGNVPIAAALPLLAAAGSPRLIIESREPVMENYRRLLDLLGDDTGGRRQPHEAPRCRSRSRRLS